MESKRAQATRDKAKGLQKQVDDLQHQLGEWMQWHQRNWHWDGHHGDIGRILDSLPKGLKIIRRVNFGAGRKFSTDVAKRYGEGSEMLVSVGKRGRKTVHEVKNYGGNKMLRT